MNLPKLYGSAIAAIVSYFILIFLEDILGINKLQRFIIAIGLGILFYHFGDDIVRFIQNIFSQIGL